VKRNYANYSLVTVLFVILLRKDLKRGILSFHFPFTLSISNKYRDIGANYGFICIFLASQTIESNYDASVITIVGLLLANVFESGFQDYCANGKNITLRSEIRFNYIQWLS